MKNIIGKIHRPAKRVLAVGCIIIFLLLTASTLLYLGAGRFFDYYSVIGISDGILNSVRPISVLVCIGALGAEYVSRQKEAQ